MKTFRFNFNGIREVNAVNNWIAYRLIRKAFPEVNKLSISDLNLTEIL